MDRKRSGPWQILACTTLDTALTSGRHGGHRGFEGAQSDRLPAEA